MPSRFEQQPDDEIDLSKRYDIYVQESGHRLIVYRGSLFRALKRLAPRSRIDAFCDFYEIEQANGDVVFIRRHSVVKFCEPDTKLIEEEIRPPGG